MDISPKESLQFASPQARQDRQRIALEITERKGALYVRKTDTATLESLRPLKGDRFAINLAPAEIIFQCDRNGKIDAVAFDWGGRMQPAPRERK